MVTSPGGGFEASRGSRYSRSWSIRRARMQRSLPLGRRNFWGVVKFGALYIGFYKIPFGSKGCVKSCSLVSVSLGCCQMVNPDG